MIILHIDTGTKKFSKNVLLIDAHSHLGRDEDGLQNMNPLSPEGTINFYAEINKTLQERLGTYHQFQIKLNDQLYRFTFEFKPHPFSYNLCKSISERCHCGSHSDLFNKLKGSWIVDQGVVFPFQDVFRDRRPEALYRASNLNISRFTTKFPYSLKLIGYARCDPMEGPKAIEEVRNAIQNLGLRGLKLHPRSDLWLDNITDQKVALVLIEAARHSIPVLFDTRGKKSILAIHQLVKITREMMKQQKQENLIPHLKVIIAHCAMGYIGDNDIYEAISDPQTFGEISMLHGKGSSEFYLAFMNWYNSHKKATGKRWSEHIIFGTDFPYFSTKHACDNIAFLLSPPFIQNGGTIIDTENILGLNILRAFSEYNHQVVQHDACQPYYIHYAMESLPNNLNIATNVLSHLIEDKIIQIPKINYMFSESYQNYQNEVLIHTQSNSESKNPKKIKLLYLNFIKNKYLLFSNLIKDEIWNPLGYKYFNPNHKKFLLRHFPFNFVSDEGQIYKSFRKIYK
ncbi:MAG: amidohydrolase family protein [Candidatus Helarchaeota archaeon]|nr:amidohydrolase family protein [Candidatus Helarchaeota archaeon]